LEAVQRAKAKTLECFFADHHSRSPEKIQTRLEEIRRAVTATHDAAVITASSSAALSLVRILREMRVAISSYDAQIERLARRIIDHMTLRCTKLLARVDYANQPIPHRL
jgi:hypothetical protein